MKTERLSLRSVLAYGFGDVGCNFSWMFVGNFLMFFYTDVFGISMSAVATLMLVARIWDAVNDPLVGMLADRTDTRWGKYRPWLAFGAPLTAVVLALAFWAHPEWSAAAKIAYAYVTYFALVLGYTCVNLPYGTLCGAMTQDIDERARLNTARSLAAMIAIGVINVVTLPLVNCFGGRTSASAYLAVAMLYGAIFAACHWFCFACTEERVAVPRAKVGIGAQFRAVCRNRPYLVALLGQFLFGAVLYGRNADFLYYFKYVAGDENLFTAFATAIVLPSVLGAVLFRPLFALTGNKGRAAAMLALLTGLAMFAIHPFSPKASPTAFYLTAALAQFFFAGFNTAIYAIIPDCVEYGEWKTGIRNDGFQYAAISFGNKLGMAIGTAGLAGALALAGYAEPAAADAPAVQNETVIAVMRHAFSTLPGALWLVTAAGLAFYRIDKQTYTQIVSELEARR
ncbi:MAG: MFS transporter [Kiritimatiellia bacterium]